MQPEKIWTDLKIFNKNIYILQWEENLFIFMWYTLATWRLFLSIHWWTIY